MQVAYESDFGDAGFGEIIWGLPEGEHGEDIRIINVNVICGTNLAKKDIFGLSDPYCVIQLVSNVPGYSTPIASLHTRVKKKTLQPVWNSSCIFRADVENHHLLFKIFDENRLTRDDFLGEARAGLNSLYTEGDPGAESNSKVVYVLGGRSHKSRVRGTITVSLLLKDVTAPPTPDTDVGDGFHAFHVAQDLARVFSEEYVHEQTEEIPSNVTEHEEHHQDREHPHPTEDSADTQASLPSNWEERQDANGRTFYVNHNNRTTTWSRPVEETNNESTELPASPEMSREFVTRRHISQEDTVTEVVNIVATEVVETDDALPPGWEARRNVNERILYINHNNRTTTWQRPLLDRSTVIEEEGEEEELQAVPPPPPPPPDANEDYVPVSVEPTSPVPGPAQPSAPAANSIPSQSLDERLHRDVPSQNESPLPPGWAMQLAPNGKIFFIDHNTRKTSWVDPRANHENTADDNGAGALPLLQQGWEQRNHSDGRVFFIDHATQSTQWEDPRIQSKAKEKSEALPYSRDYKRKYDYFKSRLKPPENVPNKYEIHVRRNSLLEDSYRFVLSSCKNVELLKTKLWIVFDGETGLDYGGVSREWFYLLSKEIFNPYYGLFEYSATDNYTLQINPNSAMCNDQHLSYFKFIGRVAGMAVYHGKLLDAFFIRPFYKMLLEKKITLQDLESVDSEYHNSLKWLLENDPEVLDLTFVIEEDVFGQYVSRELRPHGSSIPVTQNNKLEYIDLVIKWRFIDRVRDQMKSFAEGFHNIIPVNLVQMFDERELEYLLCGLGEINVDDWRLNTQYRSGYHDKHVVIQWFWKAVSTFDNEMKARLLQFVTGTSRVPMNGFAELYGSNGPQKFAIERWGSSNQLPRSHTCFNRLDLPPYLSYHELREKLRLAIENTEGFEGVD